MTTNSPAPIVPDPTAASTNSIPSELHPIRDAVEIVSIWDYVGWIAVVLAAIVLAYFLTRYWLKKRNKDKALEAARPAVPARIVTRGSKAPRLDGRYPLPSAAGPV